MGSGLLCLISKNPGPALCPLRSTVPIGPFLPSGPFGLLPPLSPPTCLMSPSRNELHPNSAHWQSRAQGDGLVAEDQEASPCWCPPASILTFLSWASKMLWRDTSTSSPSSRTPFPLGMREKEGIHCFCQSSGKNHKFSGPGRGLHWDGSRAHKCLLVAWPLSRPGTEQVLHSSEGPKGWDTAQSLRLQDQAVAPPPKVYCNAQPQSS